MSTTTPDPTTIDRETALIGLASIGVRLYDHEDEPIEPGCILAAERAVFAFQFDRVWRELSEDDRGAMRELLPDDVEAFDRMVADYERRS